MSAVFVLAKKDLKALLSSPIFYFIATCCTALWTMVFVVKLREFAANSHMYQSMEGGGRNIHAEVFLAHFSIVNLVFMFVIPALTMRLLAEEKKLRTYDLLLTSPLTATQIAMGKYLAGFGAALVLVLISALYPLATRMMAEFQAGPLVTTYLGLILISGIYVALGLFASALTESVVLSVVMGLIFNLLLWFVGATVQGSNMPLLTSVVEYLGIGQHFMGFVGGAIKLNGLVFLLSVIVLFVFLTQRVIESSRWR